VPLVVVSLALRYCWSQRQDRLCPLQRLNLGLLVQTEHQRVFWWVQIEPHNVFQLLLELWIVASPKRPHQMRLQLMLLKNLVDLRVTNLKTSPQCPCRPVSLMLWLFLHDHPADLRLGVLAYRLFAWRAALISNQPLNPALVEHSHPLTD